MAEVRGFTEVITCWIAGLELMYSGYAGKSWLHQVKASGSLPKVTDSPGRFHNVIAVVREPRRMELWAPRAGNGQHRAKASPPSATGRKPRRSLNEPKAEPPLWSPQPGMQPCWLLDYSFVRAQEEITRLKHAPHSELLGCVLSRSVVSDPLWPHGL